MQKSSTCILAILISITITVDSAYGAGIPKGAISTTGQWSTSDLPSGTGFLKASGGAPSYTTIQTSDLPSGTVNTGQSNTFGAFTQFFNGIIDTITNSIKTTSIIFRNSGHGTTLQSGTLSTTNYTVTLPTKDTTLVGTDTSDTLTGKTFDVAGTGNSLTATSTAAGDLLKSDGTKFSRFAMGSASQCLTTNAGGTDLVWGPCDNQMAYARIYDTTNQNCPASANAQNILLNTNDVISGITHSTTTNTNQITIITSGTYDITVIGQVGRSSATGADTHNIWLMKGASQLPFTNSKTYMPAVLAQTNTVDIDWIGTLSAGDVISVQESCTLTTGVTGLRTTAAGTPPGTPSVEVIIMQVN